jgi:ribulose-5-phosphate 4-epimerase/fuculose-1-phosphate aldolase
MPLPVAAVSRRLEVQVTFVPTPEKLIPDLSPREELVLLARCLWREGYNDHLAGHITYNLGDGTLLCNPWLITWDELRPSQVIRIDLAGNVVEGEWPAPLGIPLHLALHEARPGVAWAMHNHPLYGTVMADMGIVPPPLDQSSSLGGGNLVLVDEYEGGVSSMDAARSAVAKFGDADMALLAGHGVFVLGGSARAVHQRATALEQRCQHAWYVRAAGGTLESRLPESWLAKMMASSGENFIGFWEAMVRQELRADPFLLERSAERAAI